MSFYNVRNPLNFSVVKGLNPNGIQDQYKFTLQVPAGTVSQFAGAVCPEGYLFCDGSAVSRKLYNMLFYVIGTTYGSGDGSTTFNLPDFRSRVPVGIDGSAPLFNALNNQGGETEHTLTVAEMPSHNHSSNAGGAQSIGGNGYGLAYSDGNNTMNVGTNVSPGEPNLFATVATLNINNTGGGDAHNNLQPYIVVNYIIKC